MNLHRIPSGIEPQWLSLSLWILFPSSATPVSCGHFLKTNEQTKTTPPKKKHKQTQQQPCILGEPNSKQTSKILQFIESLLYTQFIVRVNYARKVESASSAYKTSPITQPHPLKPLRGLALLITLFFPISLSYLSLFQALYWVLSNFKYLPPLH